MSKEKKTKRSLTVFEQLFVVVLIILALCLGTGVMTIQDPDSPRGRCTEMCSGLAASFGR